LSLTVCALVIGAIRGIEFGFCERVGYGVVQDLRMRMYGHLQGMLPTQLQGRSRGGLVLRFTGDLSMIRTWISRGLLGGLLAVIVVIGGTAVIAWQNVWLAIAMLTVMAAGTAASLAAGRPMRRATRIMRRRRSLLTSNIDEQIHVLPVVQVFGRRGGEYARLSRQNDSLTRSLIRVANLRGRLRAIATASGLMVTVAILGVGIVEVDAGRTSIGVVIATLTVSRILNGPIRTLGLAHDYWQRSRVSERKLADYFSSASTTTGDSGTERLTARCGSISFDHVSLSGRLDDFTATAEGGQLVCVVGPNGAGKSTLLSVMARLADPDSGEVRVDGQLLSDTRRFASSSRVGIVSPDLPLMRGSVMRNVTYRMPNADQAEIDRVVALTGLDEVLSELPNGWGTWVVEGGRNLSVGQRQRISLARALLGNPVILLMDEPTANLDVATSNVVHDVLTRHHGTVLMASHDPREIALADQVWTLDKGRLVSSEAGEVYRDNLWRRSHEGVSWTPQLTP
jgi:ATP-binding cassette subfamily B protein